MWQWPLALLLAAASLTFSPSLSFAAETSSGATSQTEADVIWREANRAFEAHDYVQAANYLERIIDRYPGVKGYLKAHLLLGTSRIEMKQAERALKPLQYYVQAAGKTADGVTGRLELGRAYLAAGKKHEALLTAMELDRLTKVTSLSDHRADVLVYKANALMALDRDKEARLALDSAAKLASDPRADLATRGKTASAGLDLKLRECSRLPGKGPIDEGQLRDRINRRGQCLLEAVPLLRATFDVGHELTATQASEEASDAWIRYFDACSNPANPPGKRSAAQLKAYREELKTQLVADCLGRVNSARGLIVELKEKLHPPIASSADYVIRTLDNLKESSK